MFSLYISLFKVVICSFGWPTLKLQHHFASSPPHPQNGGPQKVIENSILKFVISASAGQPPNFLTISSLKQVIIVEEKSLLKVVIFSLGCPTLKFQHHPALPPPHFRFIDRFVLIIVLLTFIFFGFNKFLIKIFLLNTIK